MKIDENKIWQNLSIPFDIVRYAAGLFFHFTQRKQNGIPLSVIKMFIAKFIGSDSDGVRTSTRQRIKNTIGMMMLTLIGRGASGLQCWKTGNQIKFDEKNQILIIEIFYKNS